MYEQCFVKLYMYTEDFPVCVRVRVCVCVSSNGIDMHAKFTTELPVYII